MINSDIFVILDHVQYQRGFINRNKIKTSYGWEWLTVPINKNMNRRPICEVTISNSTDWADKILKTLRCNYSKTQFFRSYENALKLKLEKKWAYLAELNFELIAMIVEILGVKVKIYKSSSLGLEGKATELLVNICKKFNADTYLSGPGGKLYMETDKFVKAGINVKYQDFKHPVYLQLFPQNNFLPNLSIVDLLFNCGDESLKIIKNN